MLTRQADGLSDRFVTLLYVGDSDQGDQLQTSATSRGWNVLRPTELLEALALYVFCFPDLVVLDATVERDLAEAVFFHLRSVDAPALLVLTEATTPGPWDGLPSPAVTVIPPTAQADELLDLFANRFEPVA
ncbi:MAG: hypothetical protein ACLFVO_00435 [Chloroflexaceae bacterium]